MEIKNIGGKCKTQDCPLAEKADAEVKKN